MRDGAPSTVARFTETARSLFPQIGGDPEAALDVAEAMMMLHRRIERASVGRGASQPHREQKRRRWRAPRATIDASTQPVTPAATITHLI